MKPRLCPQSLCANSQRRAGWYLVHTASIIYSLFRNINAPVSIFTPISLFLPTPLPTLAVPELHNSYVDSLLLISSLYVFMASLQAFVLVTTFPVSLTSLSPSLLFTPLLYLWRLVILFFSLHSGSLNQPRVVYTHTKKWNMPSSKHFSWDLNWVLVEQNHSDTKFWHHSQNLPSHTPALRLHSSALRQWYCSFQAFRSSSDF